MQSKSKVSCSEVPRNPPLTNWATDLSKGLTHPKQLKDHGLLQDFCNEDQAHQVRSSLDIRVPNALLPQLKDGDPTLLRQVVPQAQELEFSEEELEDPIGDEKWTPVLGITHRYPDRALLKVTYACAMYCRFCFRRYKVSHTEESLDFEKLQPALEYLAHNKEIWEVILTGGDPLTLSDTKLKRFFDAFAKMEHIRIVRFHTRVFTALPSRITPALLDLLSSYSKQFWFVAHINSASELNPETVDSLKRVQRAGFPILAQSVLLKGVNNTHDALTSLFRGLIEVGVKPYYLHFPDLAQGTAHFRMSLDEAIDLVKGLRGRISGMCLPQLIVDIPGGKGKVAVDYPWAKKDGQGQWFFENPTLRL